MTWIALAAGLALLLGGGEALVKGSVATATRLGVSPLFIGLTLVGFGTSTPELVTSIEAALVGAPGIAVGNIVGSCIANVLLILGVGALLLPMGTTPWTLGRDGTVLIGASLLLVAVALGGMLDRWMGGGFLVLLVAYTVYASFTERIGSDGDAAAADAVTPGPATLPPGAGLALAAGGIVAVVVGAGLLVGSAIEIAAAFGLSQTVIGLTLVAIGTSLPELATTIMAAVRRQGGVALGNVIGSNIFNILGIGGATALVTPITMPAEIVHFDIWVMLATALLLVAFAASGWRISRTEGLLLLTGYAAYLAVQLSPTVQGFLGLA